MPRRSGPPGWLWTLSSTSTAFAPANTRMRVGPLLFPKARPTTLARSLPSLGLSGFFGTSAGEFRVTNVASLGLSGRKATAKYWWAVARHSRGPGTVPPPTIHFLLFRNPPDRG